MAVAVLGAGGWSLAMAAPLPDVPVPELPNPGQTYVTPDAPHGFGQPDTRPPGTAEIGNELGAPPLGNADALVLTTPDGSSKATFFTAEVAGPLSTFLSSGYYAKRDASSTGNPIQFPSFQITVDANGLQTDGGFSTLTFEPVYQSGDNANQMSGTWNKYDTGTGLFCSTRQIGGFEANQTRCDNGGLKTLQQIIDANPDIVATSAGINQGSGNPGIVSAVDLMQVGSTTYNFEKTAPIIPTMPDPSDPDPGTPGPDGPGTPGPGCETPAPGGPKDTDHGSPKDAGSGKGEHSKGGHSAGGHSKDDGHPGAPPAGCGGD